jgi:PAS domain S-box-containing protein
MKQAEKTANNPAGASKSSKSAVVTVDPFAELEATLDSVAETNPRIAAGASTDKSASDLKALLDVSRLVNSTLVLEDVLELVMRKAIEFMEAERGLIMLLDENGSLQTTSAYNLCKEEMLQEEFKISSSVAARVAKTGMSIYASDAQQDERYANQRSVVELNLRSIMCVPVRIQEEVIGCIYLDNSSQARMFLKSDLYLFELYAQMVGTALHNARNYERVDRLQKFNASVVNTSPIGLVVVDAHGRMAAINTAALEIFDLNRDDVRTISTEADATKFVASLPLSEQPRWAHMINAVLKSREDYADSRFFHNTGYVEKAMSVKISPCRELPNGDDGLIISVEDITEKVIMEKYVILSEKLVAKGEMAASIAHELNNYLAIASTNAELLTMNVDTGKYDKAKFNSKSVVENIFKIKRFVDNLMDFSRPESDYISYDVKHLIEDLLFSLRVQARFKRTQFSLSLNNDCPPLDMDVGQIQQVLMNLLNNAADAIEERAIHEEQSGREHTRSIAIETKWDSQTEMATILVTDNGTGMSEETLKKLFTLHFTTKKGGHGLGLSNCRKIVLNHGGELTVASSVGVGTTFTVRLPRFQNKLVKK